MGFVGPLSCQAHIVARTPLTRHLHLCWSFQLEGTTRNCSWPSGNPVVTGCIQLGCCKHVGQGIIVCEHVKGWPIQVFVEIFNYHLPEGEKFQLVCQVVGLSLAEAPTAIGYYSVCAILMGLVENSSKTRPTGISVKLEGLCEFCIGKNRCSVTVFSGHQRPVGTCCPTESQPFLASILIWS